MYTSLKRADKSMDEFSNFPGEKWKTFTSNNKGGLAVEHDSTSVFFQISAIVIYISAFDTNFSNQGVLRTHNFSNQGVRMKIGDNDAKL